jgi:erythromycin esterase
MIKTVCFAVLVVLAVSGLATPPGNSRAPGEPIQAEVKELRKLAVPMRSVNFSDEDSSDLLPLKDALNGVTVVGLGEATHADGAAYRAKLRLVKFLHQNMGFDVLIWEAGFLDAYCLNQALRDPAISLASAKAKLMNDTWAASENIDGLFAYARSSWQTSHPVQMAGMNGGHPDLGFDNFEHLLDDIVHNLSEHAVSGSQRAKIDALARRVFGDPAHAAALSARERYQQRQALEGLMSTARQSRRERPLASEQREDADFAEEALHATLLDESVKYYYGKYLSTRQGMWARKSNTIRETNMAELFLWLRMHHFAGKKIMIWAATNHLARKTSSNR